MQKYVVLEKEVGQTPLQCAEEWRAQHPQLADVALAYAGRLDPMASGKLLILIGNECKIQEKYHGLDKEYKFSILFGIGSDTGDVLGLIKETGALKIDKSKIKKITHNLIGDIELPYPKFSAKTVLGKPLHVWAVEGRLNEITIPTKHSRIYSLKVKQIVQKTRTEIYSEVSQKIETIPEVTDASKALGNDFRRVNIRADWKRFIENGTATDTFTIANFTCICSSGTYMRTLAEIIGMEIGTTGLAYHIHRLRIGTYLPLTKNFGFWKQYF